MRSAATWKRATPWALGLAATLAVVATLAPDRGGPGITCDELYHVAVGKQLVYALGHQGPAFFSPSRIRENFPWRPGGPPVHPPLGNWILGAVHRLFDLQPDDPDAVAVSTARFAPALAFGFLVAMVAGAAGRYHSWPAALVAGAGVALVPRLFGHAHFAALDMLTALFFAAALWAMVEAVQRGVRPWHVALAGGVWGLAMLVRLHGVLLGPPVVVWLLWHLRGKAAVPLAVWLASGLAVLYLGWPWLWLAPWENLHAYLFSGTARQAIHVYYLGQVWDDTLAPWHYPLVMFATVLPLGFLVLGGAGIWAKRRELLRDPTLTLPTLAGAGTLGVFAWPGTPVYDGVRLFLMVFPLWAVWVGVGGQWVLERLAARGVRPVWRHGILAAGVLLQGFGILAYHPAYLSHYSLLVGGLPGAEHLGLEPTYWGDSVTEAILARAVAEARRTGADRIALAPSLAPFQAPAVAMASPSLASGEVRLVPYDVNNPLDCPIVVVYRRKADLAGMKELLLRGEVAAELSRQGVWLTRVVRMKPRPILEEGTTEIGTRRRRQYD